MSHPVAVSVLAYDYRAEVTGYQVIRPPPVAGLMPDA
jgi:hypothetical protein